MKITGFTYINGRIQMVMKSDSSLLNNNKPFFVPDWSTDVRGADCVIVRISKLGKNIGEQFAYRYYDALANGINFYAKDIIEQATREGDSWSRAMAFDYSLCVGKWETDDLTWADRYANGNIIDINKAIAEASKVMTIRTGDLIFIDKQAPAYQLERNTIIERDGLYCKIK